MGDEDPGGAGVDPGAQQAQHRLARVGVQRPGGLVGEHQPALPHESAGDRDPLLLPAGHVVGEAVGELVHADGGEDGQGLLTGLPGGDPVELARQGDVLGGGERGDQVQILNT